MRAQLLAASARLAQATLPALGVAGIVLLTAGCTSPAPQGPEIINDMATAWAADVSDFPAELPSGVHWPASPPDTLMIADTSYEVGTSSMLAAHYWLCAWEDKYLTALEAKDAESARDALTTAATFAELPMVTTYVQNPSEWAAGVVGTAQAGDPTAITQDFEGGCDFYLEEQTTPKEN